MFSIVQLFFFVAVVGHAAAEVPSYIQICGAKNPNLDDCVVKSVTALHDKLRDGIPELEIPPGEPLIINKVVLADMPNFKALGSNIKLSGLTNYRINHLHVDLKKQQIDIDLTFPESRMEAIYNITARILVPIVGKGPISLTAKDVNAIVKTTFKIVDHNGKRYIYFPSMTTRLNVKDFTVKFEVTNFDKTLQEAVSQALGSSHQEVLEATTPNIEKAISERCLELANKICKHFTYDELFPDRE
ncbi:Putative beta-carotene-binding protein [Anthophora retusa]